MTLAMRAWQYHCDTIEWAPAKAGSCALRPVLPSMRVMPERSKRVCVFGEGSWDVMSDQPPTLISTVLPAGSRPGLGCSGVPSGSSIDVKLTSRQVVRRPTSPN